MTEIKPDYKAAFVIIRVDFENNAVEWWDNGGRDIWAQFAGDPCAEFVTLDAPTCNAFVSAISAKIQPNSASPFVFSFVPSFEFVLDKAVEKYARRAFDVYAGNKPTGGFNLYLNRDTFEPFVGHETELLNDEIITDLDNFDGIDPHEGGENPTVDDYVDSLRGLVAEWIGDNCRRATLEQWNLQEQKSENNR